MKFPLSPLALKYCVGEGLEVGGSAHNPFGLPSCSNVDVTDEITVFKQAEIDICGEALPVDIVAPGDAIPLPDESVDYVVSSHVLEHFFDPVAAMLEWDRLIRPGGVIFAIVPKRDALREDAVRPLTTLQELVDRHTGVIAKPGVDDHRHWTVWRLEEGVEMVEWIRTNRGVHWEWLVSEPEDDKGIRNGWMIALRKIATRDK